MNDDAPEFNVRPVIVNTKMTKVNGWCIVHISEVIDAETGEVLHDYDSDREAETGR